MGLLIVGSIGLDDIETPFDKVTNALGGSTTYISLAASYFSGPVSIVGIVGDDFPSENVRMLENHNIDLEGLDRFDRKILAVIRDQYNGGPVGIEALAATLNEETDTIVDVVEPYLLKMGFLRRTSRGREITEKARKLL